MLRLLSPIVGIAIAAASASAQRPARSVAFTFDDLPAARSFNLAATRAITTKLLEEIRTGRIPAIGFVNEIKLLPEAETPARTALLEAWLDAGIELGNHTYSHRRLSDISLAEYQADVLRGERVTRRLMAARGRQLRYYRHPTLNTGPDLPTRTAFEAFLAEHGYIVAPVTIDNDEYLYALAYDRARARADTALGARIAVDYVRYMEEMFEFFERLSVSLLGREPAQILLLHANALNADHLDVLAAMIAARGYRFVSLEEALRDPAYARPDRYIGQRGPSWLERWAVTEGRDPGRPPSIPDWVQAATR